MLLTNSRRARIGKGTTLQLAEKLWLLGGAAF